MAVRGGGAGAIEGQVGQKAHCRAPGSKRGGCRSRGSGGVGESSPGGQEPAAICHIWGGAGDTLPAALNRRSHRRPPGGGEVLGCPTKMSSTIEWHRE